MAGRRVFLLIAVVATCTLVLVLAGKSGRGPSAEELAQRIARCQPTWENYQEDIKGQIGAGFVAEWTGTPVEAWCEDRFVKVTFRLSGPWAQRNVAIPILLREPSGATFQNARASREDDHVTYTWPLLESMVRLPLPWLDLKFPHGEKRVMLSEKGDWKADPAA